MTKAEKEKKELALREKEEITRTEGEPTREGIYYSPDADIFENEASVVVMADLPGVTKERLDVDIKDGVLTITGQVDPPESRLKPVYAEYGVGGYTRRFTLGKDIDQTKISAVIKDGVLTLDLPKADRLRPRKVEIQA